MGTFEVQRWIFRDMEMQGHAAGNLEEYWK
jgi:hypothetical protein